MAIGKKTITAVESVLVLAFVGTLATGITLHLDHHGMVKVAHKTLETVHYCLGFTMIILALIHAGVKWKFLAGLKKRYPLFVVDTYALAFFLLATFGTGLVKLLVHVRGLGRWHYWLGVVMSVLVVYHLMVGLPFLWRNIKNRFAPSK